MATTKRKTRILDEMHETARGLHGTGLISKRRMGEYDALCHLDVHDMPPLKIKSMREGVLRRRSVWRVTGCSNSLARDSMTGWNEEGCDGQDVRIAFRLGCWRTLAHAGPAVDRVVPGAHASCAAPDRRRLVRRRVPSGSGGNAARGTFRGHAAELHLAQRQCPRYALGPAMGWLPRCAAAAGHFPGALVPGRAGGAPGRARLRCDGRPQPGCAGVPGARLDCLRGTASAFRQAEGVAGPSRQADTVSASQAARHRAGCTLARRTCEWHVGAFASPGCREWPCAAFLAAGADRRDPACLASSGRTGGG